LNLFLYTSNDPINLIDANGLFTWPYTWKGWAGVIATGMGGATMFVPLPGAHPVGIGLLTLGAGFTIWDTVEGFKQAEGIAKEAAKNQIRDKIGQAGGNARWLQQMGMIPSNTVLKNIGFSWDELEGFGLIVERDPSCE
jgi:hypothetical protein